MRYSGRRSLKNTPQRAERIRACRQFAGADGDPDLSLAAITVFIGLGAQPIYELADAAAEQMLDPQMYVEAVLGKRHDLVYLEYHAGPGLASADRQFLR
jgi:hypothetical protein